MAESFWDRSGLLGDWVRTHAAAWLVGIGLTLLATGILVVLLDAYGLWLLWPLLGLASGYPFATAVAQGQWRAAGEGLSTSRRRWRRATETAILIGWEAWVLATWLRFFPFHPHMVYPSLTTGTLLARGLALGAATGALVGGTQALVAWRGHPRAWWWTGSNIVGWALAVGSLFLAFDLLPDDIGPAGALAALTAASGIAGTVVGLVTGPALAMLLKRSSDG